MDIWFVDGEGVYAVDLDAKESAEYEDGQTGMNTIVTKVLQKVESLGPNAWISVYNAKGFKLYDIQGRA